MENIDLAKALFKELVSIDELDFENKSHVEFSNKEYRLLVFDVEYYLNIEEVLETEICRGKLEKNYYLIDKVQP